MAYRQLEKTYDPQQVEERWHQVWIDRGYGHASLDHPGRPYTIVIPPPNVTGSLHIGHALNNSLQDILIRWRRMQGRNTLWMPGMDHAGIATQNVVEKRLHAEGTTREALGREAFIARVWDWKAQYGGVIIQQLKRLGATCDWERLRFTLDEGLSKAVVEAFVRLFQEGLIYRGERLINWCPRCTTALSDIEVEHQDVKGQLYHISYPLTDDPTITLTVATTRPETMLGDTAVAVHPDDPRYRHLIGRTARLPLTHRALPIVGDSILVDREFGTGAVKITPAHDFNDFEAGERHGLPRLAIFTIHGRLDPSGLERAAVDASVIEEIQHLPVVKARAKVEQRLRDGGFLVKVEDHKLALGVCYRCKTVVEPSLSPQWFVNIQPLAQPAIEAVQDGRVRLLPEGWINNYLGWMRDIKDWCISRQIWWGHQIPAWYCLDCNPDAVIQEEPAPDKPDASRERPESDRRISIRPTANPIVGRTPPVSCPRCHGSRLIRDPDVLDTWFSSALWPFSTLGWPDETPELKTFYPTSTLVTGLDILFFWVARMIMMGLKFTGDVPFRDVYIHALVRDEKGLKMGKTKGNVIDPLDVMHQYGTDALRFTLASMASPGRDIKLGDQRIQGYRNFANKIWNAARFIFMHLDGAREPVPIPERTFADRWILSRLNATIALVNASLEQYRFDQASSHLYQFIWHEYCDWYLEMIKPTLQENGAEARGTRQTLVESFEAVLRLLHPFMPFISEEIWQQVPHEGESIVIQAYPEPRSDWEAKQVELQFDVLARFVATVRTARSLLNLAPGTAVTMYGASKDAEESTILLSLGKHIELLGKGSLCLTPVDDWPRGRVLRLAVEGLTIGLAVDGDIDLQKALDRVTKQRAEATKESEQLDAKLGNVEFTGKAPADVVTEHQERLRTLRHELGMLTNSQEQLRELMRTKP